MLVLYSFTSSVIILIFQRNFHNYLGLLWVGIPQLFLKNCVLSSNVLEYHHIFFYRFCTGTSYLIPSNLLILLNCLFYPLNDIIDIILSTNNYNLIRIFQENTLDSKALNYLISHLFFKVFYNLKIIVPMLMIISTGSLWFS